MRKAWFYDKVFRVVSQIDPSDVSVVMVHANAWIEEKDTRGGMGRDKALGAFGPDELI